MKIGLDAGHGLKTSGKQTPDGIKEWTLNDKVRDRVVEKLKDYDVSFIFPDNNEGSKDEGLIARSTMDVNAKVDVAVSTHHNALNGKWGKHTGVEVYVDKNCTAKDMKLAEAIYKRLVEYTGLKGRGIKKADFTVINQNKVPAVLVEGGFMDSTIDHPVITSDKGQDAYARAVAEGLIEFLGLKKKVTTTKTTSKKTVETTAKEVIDGKWGTGNTRKTKLENAGYNYDEVQAKVNEILGVKTTTKTATKASTSYYPKCTSNHTSIVSALNSIGVKSSITYRAKIAKKNNIKLYVGTVSQNTKMLDLLKKGKLIKV